MGSRVEMRLVLVSLALLAFVQISQCLSLSKVVIGDGSLKSEQWAESSDVGSVLLRQRRMTHLPICLYCCGCCKKRTCGYCCKL
ncbi:hepcidin-1 [Heterodontus francisci]|uniref:hepcidin-1 n=1 Tax=Heterodontus francisci TaxID=7792 RepID=UPI00355AE3E4